MRLSSPRFRAWILISLGAGTLAIAFKFPTFWDQWVFFPAVPNILDTAFLAVVGGYLLGRGLGAWFPDVRARLRGDDRAIGALAGTILMVVITVILTVILYVIVVNGWFSP